MAGHIAIAQREGAKAGFRQYVTHLERSGLPQSQAALDELLEVGEGMGHSKAEKAMFTFYCEKFGTKIDTTPAAQSVNGSKLEGAREALARLIGREGVGVQVEAEATPTKRSAGRPKGSKNRVKAPLSVGDTFLYSGKSGDTEWEVVGEGTTKKHKKPALVCSNGKRETPWNITSVTRLIENGTITVL